MITSQTNKQTNKQTEKQTNKQKKQQITETEYATSKRMVLSNI